MSGTWFKINYADPPPKGGRAQLPTLSVGCACDFLPKRTVQKGGRWGTLQWGYLTNTIQPGITATRQQQTMLIPLSRCDGNALHLCGLPPYNPYTWSSHEKNSSQVPRGASYDTPNQHFSKLSRSSNSRKVCERKTVSLFTTLLTLDMWVFHAKKFSGHQLGVLQFNFTPLLTTWSSCSPPG